MGNKVIPANQIRVRRVVMFKMHEVPLLRVAQQFRLTYPIDNIHRCSSGAHAHGSGQVAPPLLNPVGCYIIFASTRENDFKTGVECM